MLGECSQGVMRITIIRGKPMNMTNKGTHIRMHMNTFMHTHTPTLHTHTHARARVHEKQYSIQFFMSIKLIANPANL